MWGKQQTQEEVRCSEVKAPDIYIEAIPRQKISYLMEEYPHQEWLAYLVGRRSDHANFFVEDISVPPHKEASGASAEAEPFNIPDNCIGIIHSHHSMGAFHSGTDRAYVDRNFPVSITVAMAKGSLSFDAISYQTTPCGKGLSMSCVVKYVQPPPLFDKKPFLKEAKANIEKGVKVVTVTKQQSPTSYRFDKELGAYVQTGVVTYRSKVPMRRTVTHKEAHDIQKRIKDLYNAHITRSEAEELALKSDGDLGWLWESDD